MEIKISQFCAMIFIIISSCFMGILDSSLVNISGIDCWMVPLIGMITGLPILLLYLYIYSYKKELNINQLLTHLFGNKIGKFISFLLLLFCISFTMITFWNLTNFVASQYLYNTPNWFIDILFIITTFYFFNKNERTIYRSTLMLSYIAIILFLIGSTNLTGKIQIINFKPFLNDGVTPVFKCLINYITYTTIPIFLLLITPKNKIDYKNINKSIIITYFLSHISIFITLFTLIGVFGIDLASLYQYPLYHLLKRVFIGGFIERLENVLSIGWIIILFIPCAFSSYYSLVSIKNIFNIKKKRYIYPVLIFIMFMSQFIFKSNTFGEYFLNNFYPMFMSIIIIIMIIIFVKILVHKKKYG